MTDKSHIIRIRHKGVTGTYDLRNVTHREKAIQVARLKGDDRLLGEITKINRAVTLDALQVSA
jgi:hypothetical protein